jgi:hypothetical protein
MSSSIIILILYIDKQESFNWLTITSGFYELLKFINRVFL